MSRNHLRLLVAALLVPLALYGASHFSSRAAAPAGAGNAPISVSTATAQTRPFAVVMNATGTARAWQSITIRTRVDGEIKALRFAEGQDVKAGDLLVELDDRSLAAAAAAALADRQNYEAQLRQANLDLGRSRRLAANGNAATQTVDQLQARVDQLKAQTDGAQAQYDAAQVQLGYARITAPIDGRIGLRRVDAGNFVRAADTNGIATLNQINPIAVVMTLPQQMIPELQQALKAGQPLAVAVRTEPGNPDAATGTLSTIDNAIDDATGALTLKAQLDNAKNELWPGQSVLVRLTLRTIPDALQVPLTAIQRGPDSTFVYRITSNTAEMVPVEVQYQDDTSAVIKGSISAGDVIVTDGQLRLKPGSTVRTGPGDAAAQ